MNQTFDTVLVANRGEIACRIIATLRRMGIRSAAVYSDADADARHVREADIAVRLGPAAPAESYLNIPALLAACRATGADAVHPGYGFLSESPALAEALAGEGIIFIGPGTDALALMGDKINARNHVQGYGVPVVPGVSEPGLDDAALVAAAADVGFPLLIKPSAGGGGKGMQAVHDPADLPAALAAARRVAGAAFGDDTLLLERLVLTARHIEVQVLADRHGHTIHLGERECSLQRRHQKVIEEAPSPLLDDAARARMGEAACAAARSVGYVGAGTVEFLVPADAPDEFFFMEMNTRLQVEHPVTELVTGLDLVEWQVRIAAGGHLTVQQDEVRLDGHAVEARLYAENPAEGFLPAGGTVVHLREPRGPGVRVDSALLPGLRASTSYDPLLAKVIAWGPDRGAALDRLDRALAETQLLGVPTNVEYLRLLVADRDVRQGALDTGLIERRLPSMTFRTAGDPELAAVALLHLAEDRNAAGSGRPAGAWARADGWRLGTPADEQVTVGAAAGAAGDGRNVTIRHHGGRTAVRIGAGPFRSARLISGGTDVRLELDGILHSWVCAVEHPAAEHPAAEHLAAEHSAGEPADPGTGPVRWLGAGGWSTALRVPSRRERLAAALAAAGRPAGAADPVVRSPMPGTVTAVAVADGAPVRAGDHLLSIEAMKMEHRLTAPLDGTVSLTLSAGDLVKAGQSLAHIHPEHPEGAPDAGL